MTILKAPAGTLTDGVVELRLPSPEAGDITTISRYLEDEQLEGGWLPDVPLVTGEQLVKDWLDCWNGRRGHRRVPSGCRRPFWHGQYHSSPSDVWWGSGGIQQAPIG
jgi:hypothetical protein